MRVFRLRPGVSIVSFKGQRLAPGCEYHGEAYAVLFPTLMEELPSIPDAVVPQVVTTVIDVRPVVPPIVIDLAPADELPRPEGAVEHFVSLVDEVQRPEDLPLTEPLTAPQDAVEQVSVAALVDESLESRESPMPEGGELGGSAPMPSAPVKVSHASQKKVKLKR